MYNVFRRYLRVAPSGSRVREFHACESPSSLESMQNTRKQPYPQSSCNHPSTHYIETVPDDTEPRTKTENPNVCEILNQ